MTVWSVDVGPGAAEIPLATGCGRARDRSGWLAVGLDDGGKWVWNVVDDEGGCEECGDVPAWDAVGIAAWMRGFQSARTVR